MLFMFISPTQRRRREPFRADPTEPEQRLRPLSHTKWLSGQQKQKSSTKLESLRADNAGINRKNRTLHTTASMQHCSNDSPNQPEPASLGCGGETLWRLDGWPSSKRIQTEPDVNLLQCSDHLLGVTARPPYWLKLCLWLLQCDAVTLTEALMVSVPCTAVSSRGRTHEIFSEWATSQRQHGKNNTNQHGCNINTRALS